MSNVAPSLLFEHVYSSTKPKHTPCTPAICFHHFPRPSFISCALCRNIKACGHNENSIRPEISALRRLSSSLREVKKKRAEPTRAAAAAIQILFTAGCECWGSLYNNGWPLCLWEDRHRQTDCWAFREEFFSTVVCGSEKWTYRVSEGSCRLARVQVSHVLAGTSCACVGFIALPHRFIYTVT